MHGARNLQIRIQKFIFPHGNSFFQAPRSVPLDSSGVVFVVFMRPKLRYGPGMDKNRFWDTPSKKKLERMLGVRWFDAVILTGCVGRTQWD